MKTKIVVWGEDSANDKVLLAIELLERDNKILIHKFPAKIATEEFYQLMLDKWRENQEVAFPEGYTTIERPLSMSDSLLPDDLKVEKTDIITRAQTEWHFVVLSSKLYESYKTELDELKDKVDNLSEYSESQWNELVEFWAKVSNQLKEHTLFKDHGSTLKERTNILFDKLKELKKEIQKQFDAKSKELATELTDEVNAIKQKVEDGLAVSPLFDDLKAIQEKYYKAQLGRTDKNRLWSMIDEAFKILKESKGSRNRNGDSRPVYHNDSSHIQSRYDGLISAIKKMEISIKKDNEEVDFQNKRINTTDGQLEAQIRQAKLKMIEQRISSKQEKLDDMLNTKKMLESKMESAKQNEHKKEVRAQVEGKIAASMAVKQEELTPLAEQLKAAADEIKSTKTSKTASIVESIMDKVEDVVEDVIVTVAAVAEVVEDKMDIIEDKIEETIDDLKKKPKKEGEEE